MSPTTQMNGSSSNNGSAAILTENDELFINQGIFFFYESIAILCCCFVVGLLPWCFKKQNTETILLFNGVFKSFGIGSLASASIITFIRITVTQNPSSLGVLFMISGFTLMLTLNQLIDNDGAMLLLENICYGLILACVNWTESNETRFIIFVGIFCYQVPYSFYISAKIMNRVDLQNWSNLIMVLGAPVATSSGFITLGLLEGLKNGHEEILMVGIGVFLFQTLCKVLPENLKIDKNFENIIFKAIQLISLSGGVLLPVAIKFVI